MSSSGRRESARWSGANPGAGTGHRREGQTDREPAANAATTMPAAEAWGPEMTRPRYRHTVRDDERRSDGIASTGAGTRPGRRASRHPAAPPAVMHRRKRRCAWADCPRSQQALLGDDGSGRRVAERSPGIDDLRRELQQVEDLGDAGAGHTEVPGQMGQRRAPPASGRHRCSRATTMGLQYCGEGRAEAPRGPKTRGGRVSAKQ
jgi:hypothetical protein